MNRKDYQAIIDLTSEALGISSIPVRIKNVYGGRANNNYITLPKWLEKYDEEYQIYYAVHETCHYVNKGTRHKPPFKAIEDKMLSLWNIKIERYKTYPKALYSNGKRIKNIVG